MDRSCSSYQHILNLSDPETVKANQPTAMENLLVFAGMPSVLVIGILGNLAFLLAVFRIPRMKTLTNSYLAQVALTDLVFIVSTTTAYIYQTVESPIRFTVSYTHWSGCFSVFFVFLFSYTISLFLITLVTVERFYAICRPLQMLRITGKGRSRKLVAFLWISSFFLTTLAVLQYARLQRTCVIWPSEEEYARYPQVVHSCVAVSAHPSLYVVSEMSLTFPYYILLPMNLYMYTMIIYTLGNRMPMTEIDQANVIQTKKIRNQVARLLIINGVVFFVCQSPIRIISIHDIVQKLTGVSLFTPLQYGLLVILGRILLFINAASNPVIYITTSSFYRQAIWEAISCKVKEIGGRSEGQSMTSNI
ncbi:thyrotropin-releasing hormone receptor-like [Amphiura filiformis]|uniref:thyrotropin-releasing hormone receptor-like n=1 Tax=Amphiura filiformis TaxID=82378 RepID=UPI003B20D7D2